MPKVICFLSSMHPPLDKRVFVKEAISLKNAGYDVVHLSPGAESSHEEEGIWLEIYPPVKGLSGRIVNLWNLYSRAKKLNAVVYHCNEIDSWIVGLLIKLTRKTKVIFDVHEYYPGDFSENYSISFLRPLASAMIKLLYRMLAPVTDHFIFAKRSIAADFPNTAKKQSYIFNYSQQDYRDRKLDDIPDDVRALFKNKFTAVHFGIFSKVRGWPIMLEAMRHMSIPNFQLLIIGSVNDGSIEELLDTADRYGLTNKVVIKEWMPYNRAFDYLLCAQVGLILFQPGVMSHVYAFPHKLFDYMLAGIPVIYPCFANELAPMITTEQCGALIDSSSPEEINAVLERYYRDSNHRIQSGQNGKRAVIEKYNWRTEEKKLIDLYEKLLS